MKLSFRQGIVNRQKDISDSPVNVVRSSGDNSYVDLVVAPTPTIVTLAHGNSDYTVSESKGVEHAWGSFDASSDDRYLLLDLDLVSGKVSYVSTIHPIIVSDETPNSPLLDQHWFDLNSTVMKVYTSLGWKTKARVLLATLESSGAVVFPDDGTQVGLNDACDSGYVLIDDDLRPIVKHTGALVTTTHKLLTNVSSTKTSYYGFQVETYLKPVTSDDTIPAYSLVQLVDNDKVEAANYSLPGTRISGMILEDNLPGEYVELITYCRVTNTVWDFGVGDINKPLFSDTSGQLTLSPPNVGVSQTVGYVMDSTSIMLNIQQPIVLTYSE